MHEASIALAIVDEVCERSASSDVEKIAAVHVRIGALSSVVPQALQFAWDVATEGTLACDSTLHIESVPLAVFCATCRCEQTITQGTLPICPVCETSSTEIVRGRELLVTAMEVIYAATPGGRSAEHSAQEYYAGA